MAHHFKRRCARCHKLRQWDRDRDRDRRPPTRRWTRIGGEWVCQVCLPIPSEEDEEDARRLLLVRARLGVGRVDVRVHPDENNPAEVVHAYSGTLFLCVVAVGGQDTAWSQSATGLEDAPLQAALGAWTGRVFPGMPVPWFALHRWRPE